VFAQGQDLVPPDASGVDVTALIRVGWSPSALHLHIHVNKEPVRPAPYAAAIYEGDAIEIFAAVPGPLTGLYGVGHDMAIQLIAAPPDAARAEVFTRVTDYPLTTLTPSEFAARLVDGGYEVELELPWTLVAGDQDAGAVAENVTIGFDFSCDVAVGDGGRAQSSLFRRRVPDAGWGPDAAPTPCSTPPGQPFCDDRTWCNPTPLP
jgi:Carbohydrate family 9 binding domain-like